MQRSIGRGRGGPSRPAWRRRAVPTATQQATHALLYARRDVRDVGARGRVAFAKHHGAGIVRAENPIGHQDVEVHKASE